MVSISRTDDPSGVALVLDSTFTGGDAAVAAKYCDELLQAGTRIHVTLGEIGAIDERGWQWLVKLAQRGIVLSGRNIYVLHLIHDARSHAASPRPAEHAASADGFGRGSYQQSFANRSGLV